MSSATDFLLVLLLTALIGALLWIERDRFLAMVSRPTRTLENGAALASYYWRLARQAGVTPYDAWPYYLASKIALAVMVPLLVLDITGFGWGLLLALLGFMIPDAFLAYVRRQRKAAIRRSLSFFLDLMVSLLQAGLGLEEAFARAARQGLAKAHPLAREARQVVEELSLGRDRSVAFQLLWARTGVPELRGLANALSLALTQGGSVEGTLRAQAELARARRREDGLKRLSIMNAQVLLPLILCGFPVFIVLVLVPVAMRALQGLQDLGKILRVQ